MGQGHGRRDRSGVRVLALDVGTSSVRALVADERGRPLPEMVARRPTELLGRDGGTAELDAEAVVALTADCIDELHEAGHLDGVAAVGMSCLWHALVGVDAGNRPLTPIYTWADTRATSAAVRLRERLRDPDAYRRRTGAMPHNTYWTAKLAWLADRDGPRPRRWLGLSELLTAELLGDASASVSMASGTGLLDLAANDWDPEALDLAGVRADELPPLAPRGWSGRLGAEGRRRWPALASATWAPAVGDGAAANLGSGCDRLGLAAVTIGTSAAVRTIGGGPDLPLPPSLWRYRVDHDRVITGAAFSGGGNLYEWAREVLRLPDPDDLEAALAKLPPGGQGLTVLPFHAGARPPLDLPAGSGVMAGLSLTTTPEEIVAATLTAPCFGLAAGYEALTAALRGDGASGDEPTLVASGGALLASPWWQRTLAAVLGRPLRVLPEKEASARGAAITALAAAGGEASRPEGARTVEPDPAAVEAERRARTRYETLLGRVEYK
jgi:gluconokinase